jgi:tRNA(Arg) A34 adenosine deaminase TadA
MQGGPFGAVIVKNGRVLAVCRNTVLRDQDATSHAEIRAIRIASKKLESFDLSGCEIYSTTEPCLMCFAAIHWARIDRVSYGTTIADVAKIGFNELHVSNAQMKRLGHTRVKIQKGFLRDECRALLKAWAQVPDAKVY